MKKEIQICKKCKLEFEGNWRQLLCDSCKKLNRKEIQKKHNKKNHTKKMQSQREDRAYYRTMGISTH